MISKLCKNALGKIFATTSTLVVLLVYAVLRHSDCGELRIVKTYFCSTSNLRKEKLRSKIEAKYKEENIKCIGF